MILDQTLTISGLQRPEIYKEEVVLDQWFTKSSTHYRTWGFLKITYIHILSPSSAASTPYPIPGIYFTGKEDKA